MTPRDDGAGGRPGWGASGGPLPERLPGLSAALVLVLVLALLAAPAAGAALAGSGHATDPAPASQSDAPGQGDGAGNGNGGGGPPEGGDGSANGNGGGSSDGDGAGSGQGSSGQADGDSSGSGAGGSGSGNDGGSSDGGSSEGSSSTGGSSNGGPSDDGPSNGASSNGGSGDRGADGSNAGGDDRSGGRDNGPAGDEDDDPGRSGDARGDGPGDKGDAPGRPDATRGNGPPGDGERGPPDGEGQPDGDDRGPPADRGPTVEVTRGQPAGPPDEARGPADGPADGPPASVVTVAVSGARSGDDVSLDVSPGSSAAGPVAFDQVSLTVRRDGDFTMRVTSSSEPLPGSPTFEPADGADALGRVRLDHSIANADVSSVSFVVRVAKQRLRATGTDVEHVSLYRFADGDWTALPTEVVGESGSTYLLRVASPGLSEFAVGAKRPTFEAFQVGTSDRTVEPGERVRFSTRVSNVGGASGVYPARLVVDGQVVDVRHVTVAAGGTRQVNFRRAFERPGVHAVRIGDTAGVDVVVRAEPEPGDAAEVGQFPSLVFDRFAAGLRTLWTPWDPFG